ncbi:hypothetical protein K439DRAFT_1635441 [Ramaria rubella]|nr:hypothetical protein K439DRAFT_1635441 [Ramaria rubella]
MTDPNHISTPLSKKIVPVRGAAQKAAATLKEQSKKQLRKYNTQESQHIDPTHEAESDLTDEDDDETTDADVSSQERGRGLRGRPRGRGRGRPARSRGGIERKTITRRPSKKSLHAAPSPSSSSRSPSPTPSGALETPQKRSRIPTSDKPSKRTKITSPRKAQPNTSLTTDLLTASPCHSPSKYDDIYNERDVVWVRLDSQGALANGNVQDNHASYWWPAQITGDNPLEVSVKLFGDDGHGANRSVNVTSPSASTIVRFREDGNVRFSQSTFFHIVAETTREASAIKTPTELLLCWIAARDKALEADLDDELPEAPLLIHLMSNTGGKKKDRKPSQPVPPESPTPNPSKQKPTILALDKEIKVGMEDGELVLASDHKGRPDHWPARVVGVTQDPRTVKWLYEVQFIDGKRKKMERHRFFSSDQEGFATCQMGIWQTKHVASDSEAPDSEDELHTRYDKRLPSPSPSNSDLKDIEDPDVFCARPLVEQMRYVYPFLCRVIKREYEPSHERHDTFLKGGKARDHLGHAASLRGHFSDNELKKVLLLVRKTMLRDERWAERVQDGDEVYGQDCSTAPPDASREAKIESVADSVTARSSDLDAALALTDLQSSDGFISNLPIPSTAQISPILTVVPSHETLKTSIPMGSDMSLPPPSSLVQDQSSDMELDSEGENASVSSGPSQKVENELPCVVPDFSSRKSLTFSEPRLRPTGCEAYESLSRSERGLYCADVLFPEAVLQLHLLRDGRRKSARLLTTEEENKLYEEGQELIQVEAHWVTQIVQMRQLAENTYKKKSKKKEDVPLEIIGGTSTRPKARRISA